MVEVSEALTRRVAELARLELSDEEVRTFTPQLNQILHYVEQLQQLDLKADVEPLTHPLSLETPLREDCAAAFPLTADGEPKTVQAAPESVEGAFRVPRIL